MLEALQHSVSAAKTRLAPLGNKNLQFAIVVAISVFLWFMPTPVGMPLTAQHALAVLTFLILCWATNCIAAGHASIIMIGFVTLFMHDEIPPESLLSYWQRDTMWFILLSFGFAAMMEKSGLGERLSTYIFSAKSLLATDFVMAGIIITMSLCGISDNSPKVVLFFPLILSMAQASGLDKKNPYVRHLAISFCVICCSATLIFYQGGFINTMLGELAGLEVNFETYLVMWTVPAIVLNIIKVFVCYFTFKPKKGVQGFDYEKIAVLRKNNGPLSSNEKKSIAWVAVALLLWVTASRTGFSTGYVAIFVISLAMLPKIGVINFQEYINAVRWPLIFMIMGVMCVSSFASTGLVDWLWGILLPESMPENKMLALIVISMLSMLLHIPFGAVSGAVALAIPVFAGLGSTLGIANECVVFVAYMSLVGQAFFPYQAVTYVAGMAFDIFDARDLLKIGVVLFFAMPFITAVVCYPWYMYMGWV